MAFNGRRYRRRRQHIPGHLHPLAIVGICAGAVILITIIIGNLLHFWLDDETLDRLTSGKPQEEEPAPDPVRSVPMAKMYPFLLGGKVSSLGAGETEIPAALAVALNTPDGTLLYHSEVSDFQQTVTSSAPSLSKSIEELRTAVPYLCGVFYPQAPAQKTADLQYAATASESALLREVAGTGVSEILLTGLSFDDEHLNDTLQYLRRMDEMIGDSVPIGVAVPFEIALKDHTVGLLPYLKQFADYLALDLQTAAPADAEQTLLTANYYLVTYQMRLLLSSDQTGYISIAESTLSDFQIIPASQTPADDGTKDSAEP